MRDRAKLVVLLLVVAATARLAGEDWKFAVSGDSRNCGDIVMPLVAQQALKERVQFYWHLGDFRLGMGVDQDMSAAGKVAGKKVHIFNYPDLEWPDFIENQLKPFGATPVYLTIGNHELVLKSREHYIKTFAPWINQNSIAKQRESDHAGDNEVRTYYHWVQNGIDFISLDDASHEQFTPEQVQWFEGVLAADAASQKDGAHAIKAVVVGSHAALPDSLASGHSMNDWDRGRESGRQVYADLVRWHDGTKRPVYILASHSHFFMEGIFHTAEKIADKTELPGIIVGTAGAERYRLPDDAGKAYKAQTNVYGFLLVTVHDDGSMDFSFREIMQGDVPAALAAKYGDHALKECFEHNHQ